MRVLIIEDEECVAVRLSNMIKKIRPNATILETIDSVEDGISWFNNNESPDIAFVDIQLSDGISFTIFETINVKCPIVFTTAYDNFAIKAFELNSIDYLLKPVSSENLEKSITKFESLNTLENSNDSTNISQLNSLLSSMHNSNKIYKKRFLINKASSLKVIMTDDISHFHTENKGVFLITNRGEKHEITYSLDQLEEKLDPNTFFRINRQYIISIVSIKEIHNYFNYKLKIELHKSDDQEIIVSRHKASLLKDWIND